MPEADKGLAAEQMIYFFGLDACEGDAARKDVLGGKGASLIAMSCAGLPVPPGFVISIACCRHYQEQGGRWPQGLESELRRYVGRLEQVTGRRFGQGRDPLLVSVRSGAAVSMPGMMDTILNCGLHPGLADEVADKALFWMVYAAFVQQFAATVAKIPAAAFDEESREAARAAKPERTLAERYMRLYEGISGRKFPLTAWDALRECINAVFDSWNNERAIVYRKSHGLEGLAGTAVTVQSMFNSQVSGIAFTANPSRPAAEEIIIESSYGLGESIVSGDVTPDRFVLDRRSLRLKETTLGHKDHIMSGLTLAKVPLLDPSVASLADEQVSELARLAVKVENYFGHPVDIEWGLADGRFTLLQSRPIRGLDVALDVEQGRQEEIARLKQLAASEGTKNGKVWIVHNLAETLETPTPLTWDIMRGFMSGDGGFGVMYKDFGYRPTERVCREGFLELICGRIYCDADRAAELFWEGMPLEYDHQEVLANPRLLEAAPTKFEPAKADERFLLRLPKNLRAMIRSGRTMKKARRAALKNFRDVALPRFLSYLKEQRARDSSWLPKLSTQQVIAEINDRIQRVLTDFGKESLKPGFFGGCARAELEAKLVQLLGPAEGPMFCQTLTSGLEGDTTVEQNALLFKVAHGRASLEDFLKLYGHRAVAEMELAKPRWREDDDYLLQIVASQKTAASHSPASLHKANAEKRERAMRELPEVLARWGGGFLRCDIEALAVETQQLLPYRETGKHYLLMGYELIRQAILELGRRWKLGDDVFFLHLNELEQFEQNRERLTAETEKRKIRWRSARRLDLPDVINSAELDQLGLPRQIAAVKEMKALALSSGVVTGTARVVRSPDEAKDLGDDCILVCPSTDPSWTALFTIIKGLIVERGGVLSHGAITARDFSIPAVACPDATLIVKSGAKVRVDGDRGHVTIIEEREKAPQGAPA